MNKDPYDFYVIRCAHVLTSNLSDIDMLNAIRIIYKQAFFPERVITDKERDLIDKLYVQNFTDEVRSILINKPKKDVSKSHMKR